MITTGGDMSPYGDSRDAGDSNKTVTVTERSQACIATVMQETAGQIGYLEYLNKSDSCVQDPVCFEGRGHVPVSPLLSPRVVTTP